MSADAAWGFWFVLDLGLPGSTHFFFDVGNGNTVAFFDLPGVDVGPYAEVFGGLHHLAISMEPQRWQEIRARMELIADPLGEMYGRSIF